MARFVPLDADYATDEKILAAGPIAELLYIRALAFSMRMLSDGFISTLQIRVVALGLPGATSKHVARLVEVGLWQSCDGGWQIVGWKKRHKPAAEIKNLSATRKAAGQRGNHDRWHRNGRWSDGCPICDQERSQTIANGDRPKIASAKLCDSLEVEVEVEVEELDDQDGLQSAHSSSPSSSTPEIEHVIDLAVSALAYRDRSIIRNPNPWRHSTTATMRTERAEEIATALARGEPPETIAGHIAGGITWVHLANEPGYQPGGYA